MKALKIILGIICLALTLNTCAQSSNSNENIGYYLPITIVFIIGILLFKSAFKTNSKDD